MSDGYTIVGRIRKPHGIHGEFVVEIICDEPDAVFAPGRRLFVGGSSAAVPPDGPQPVELRRARPFKDAMLLTFDGVPDRNEAELWRNRFVLIPTADVRPPGEGEVWLHEIAGMKVVDVGGAAVGEVRDVQAVPQGYLLDVATPRGVVSVPFVVTANMVPLSVGPP